jgi:ribosome-binding factor A
MPREFSRKLRVAAELQRLLNELLYAEVKDPRLAGVTVNEVELSGDLGVAKIYFATLDPDADAQAAQAGFEKAAGFLRLRIGQSLRLRRVPELHFLHDLSAQRGFELTRLIDEAARREDTENTGVVDDDGDDRGEYPASDDHSEYPASDDHSEYPASDDEGDAYPSDDGDDPGDDWDDDVGGRRDRD